VVVGVAIVAAYANRDVIALKIKSVYVRVPPKAANGGNAGGVPGAVRGDAPWALSALPECFQQRSKATSSDLAYALAHLPKGATMVRPPATLRYADCTLTILQDTIYVTRGSDRLRIPPHARLYTGPNALALLRVTGSGYELRTYDVSGY